VALATVSVANSSPADIARRPLLVGFHILMVVHITYLHCQSSEDSPGSRGTYAPSQNSLLNMIHCCLLSLTRFLSWE